MLVVIAAVFLALGLWQVRWQRRLIVLGNKLNNQAFQTLRGLPKLRVAAAENFAYAAWAARVRPQPRTAAAGRPDQEPHHGARRRSTCRCAPC